MAKEHVDMSQHFSLRQLLAYTAPAIAMSTFMSLYGIIDGLFISNCAGKTAFAGVNFIMPFIMILSTIGFMIGTGGSAVVSTIRGEGDDERANRVFSFLVYCALAFGVAFAILGAIFMRDIGALLGASGEMLETCVVYGRISMISLPCFILQSCFQSFFSAAGKPNLGFYSTLASGIANIIGDFILVGVLGYGAAGAATATVISEYIGGIFPLVYFSRKNSSALRLTKTSIDLRVLGKTCVNGSSEMMSSIAMSLVGMLYNFQLLRLLGENGVAAYGAIMYVGMIFGAVFMGYTLGCSPLMSFQNGAQNDIEKRSLLKKSLQIIGAFGILMVVCAELLSGVVAYCYCGYDVTLYEMTVRAFRLYSLSFMFTGFAVYGSSLFTSLENGLVSALISFLRTCLFEAGAVLLLPVIFGANAIWFSFLVAEIAAASLSFAFLFALRKRYGFA